MQYDVVNFISKFNIKWFIIKSREHKLNYYDENTYQYKLRIYYDNFSTNIRISVAVF